MPTDVTATRGHSMKLIKSHTRLNIRSLTNFRLLAAGWSSLLDEVPVVTANTVGSFRTSIGNKKDTVKQLTT